MDKTTKTTRVVLGYILELYRVMEKKVETITVGLYRVWSLVSGVAVI